METIRTSGEILLSVINDILIEIYQQDLEEGILRAPAVLRS